MRIGVSRQWATWLGAIGLALWMSLATAQPGDAGAFGTTLQQMLADGSHPYVRAPDLRSERTPLQQLYERRGWQPLWSEDQTPTRSALATLSLMRGAENYGLHGSDYEANQILYHLVDLVTTPGTHPDQWAHFDLALSAAVHGERQIQYTRREGDPEAPAKLLDHARDAAGSAHTRMFDIGIHDRLCRRELE